LKSWEQRGAEVYSGTSEASGADQAPIQFSKNVGGKAVLERGGVE